MDCIASTDNPITTVIGNLGLARLGRWRCLILALESDSEPDRDRLGIGSAWGASLVARARPYWCDVILVRSAPWMAQFRCERQLDVRCVCSAVHLQSR